MKKKYKKALFIILFTIISSIPIFYQKSGLVQGDDINFHLKRILGVADNLSILKMIPVYYNYLNHFGYGNGLFYPDIFLYIPAFFYKLGIPIINSCKIFILLINLVSLISINICRKNITKSDKIANIGIILYATSLYRFTDMYMRGALGECITFVFIPLVILGLYKIFYENYKEGYYLSIGLIGLMLSHIITTYMMIFFIIIFSIINYKCLKDKNRIKYFIIHIILSMLTTAYFWLPMIEQLISDKFNLAAHVMIIENCVPILALFMDFQPIIYDEWLPPGIGIMYYITIFFFPKIKEKNKFINSIYIISIILLIATFLRPLWKIPIVYKVLSIIQFPWRLNGLITVLLLVVTCDLLKKNKNIKLKKIILGYTIFIYIFNCSLTFVNSYIYDNLYPNSIMFGEYLPIEMKDNYEEIIKNYKNKNIKYNYDFEKLNVEILKYKEQIEVPLIYYKGYTAEEEGKKYNVSKGKNGLLNVDINKDTKKIEIYYEGTTISKVGKLMTLIGVISLTYHIYIIKKRGDNID